MSLNISLDIEQDVYAILLNHGEPMYGYVTDEYIQDMGTPERMQQVIDYITNKNE